MLTGATRCGRAGTRAPLRIGCEASTGPARTPTARPSEGAGYQSHPAQPSSLIPSNRGAPRPETRRGRLQQLQQQRSRRQQHSSGSSSTLASGSDAAKQGKRRYRAVQLPRGPQAPRPSLTRPRPTRHRRPVGLGAQESERQRPYTQYTQICVACTSILHAQPGAAVPQTRPLCNGTVMYAIRPAHVAYMRAAAGRWAAPVALPSHVHHPRCCWCSSSPGKVSRQEQKPPGPYTLSLRPVLAAAAGQWPQELGPLCRRAAEEKGGRAAAGHRAGN